MIGLDTTAIIDIFKGNEGVGKFLESNEEPLAASRMNYVEIFFGINPEKNKEEKEYYRKFFNAIYFIELTDGACERASEIYFGLKEKGKIISKFDCLIAACLLESGVSKLLTRNAKHFKRIDGLKVLEY